MWYDKKRPADVAAPTRGQLITLRLMILLGFGGMGLFLWGILQTEHISNAPLYYVLMFSMLFQCAKVTYEWYHYFKISVPADPVLRRSFKVDVLTTFCPGEPYDMVIETLEAIQKITYPHTTYLCDEANDPFLKNECRRLGVVHVTRDNRKDAKAGNINNALKQATGDICLVLDPDHVPAPHFFDHVLPHFQDPLVGFVQVVQAYKNINENIIAKGSAQQTFQFYGPMMMTMGSYGTVQAIGANCTFRRAALNSIGGHAPGLAEDMNTSMKLHARGWKSVYVPRVLTRGLVPSSLSAYYKQQLKWSRGVFELLVTTYVQNFFKFSWRQKLHYGLLPWHYFSGAIFLINFLIPIISLLFGVMPMKINLGYFLLLGMLFVASTYLIRHYVQRWVMEEEERGFHMVGGLLLIGTWWIHLLGFIFTLLRKKVPYNPTPKDGKEENTFSLNIPNMALGVLSAFAIGYGLYRDVNPYSIVMAGFAAINILFVLFMLWASYQNRFHRFRKTSSAAGVVYENVHQAKAVFWVLRHRMYGVLRIVALPFLLLLVAGLYYYARTDDITRIEAGTKPSLQVSRYAGIFLPGEQGGGKASLSAVAAWSGETGISPGIISTYMAWAPLETSSFPFGFLDSIYNLNAYPMITWEPWVEQLSTHRADTLSYMERIAAGRYDHYLVAMAENFRQMNKPLFLRFAHEPDNPAYPWSSAKATAGNDYKKAWRHVHGIMQARGAYNVIWVYNPWKADAAEAYFPGAGYVDWLGVTALNYGSTTDGSWHSFEALYAPFHRNLVFQQGLPVMLAEFGTLEESEGQPGWFSRARERISEAYPEVKACILFVSKKDLNVPPGSKRRELNWFDHAGGFATFKNYQHNFTPPQPLEQLPSESQFSAKAEAAVYRAIEGVNYVKGQDWQASLFPLFRKVVLADFRAMDNLGIQWIKRYGPGVYDQNILTGAEALNLNVMYALWIENDVDFLNDREALTEMKRVVLAAVENNRDSDVIKAWHLGNPSWHSLAGHFPKPQLMYQRQAWLHWASGVVNEIKALDSTRPVSIEVDDDPYLQSLAHIIKTQVPGVDAIGVNLYADTTDIDALMEKMEKAPVAMFINRLPHVDSVTFASLRTGWFLASWQDDVFENYVSFGGLKDHDGRKKIAYQYMEQRRGIASGPTLPEISILPPALLTYPGNTLRYQALLKPESQWQLAAFDSRQLEFSWQLVKVDAYGNALAMRREGTGVSLNLVVPPDPHLYRLRLSVSQNGYAVSTEVPLGTPVYSGADLKELSADEIDHLFKESKKGGR